jgi:membrane-bound lytic murein transglycosylase B
MRPLIWQAAAALLAFSLQARAAEGYSGRPEVRKFVAEMVEKHGFARRELDTVFARARRQPAVLRAMVPSAESPQRSWQVYRGIFVSPERIDAGVRFRQANAQVLARASAAYGVPEEVIVAIIGIETVYGRNLGNYRVIDALATLAFDFPQRADYFRGELEQYLLYAREEGVQVLAPKGSYAGAMGIPQFMPGTYRRFAVDFDGDGRRDLWGSAADIAGSVANFLREHGWRTGQPAALRAQVGGEAFRPLLEAPIKPARPAGELASFGVTLPEAVPAELPSVLVELQTPGQAPEYWVGFDNFYALTRYNRSSFYAVSVLELARAIDEAYKAGK